jgi:hypothetical protein
MPRARTRFFAFAASLALCACAGVRWQKPDGNDAELARDLGACRKEAQARYGSAAGVGLSSGYDPRFGAPAGPSQSDLMMQQSQAEGRCMRERGYVLVPD